MKKPEFLDNVKDRLAGNAAKKQEGQQTAGNEPKDPSALGLIVTCGVVLAAAILTVAIAGDRGSLTEGTGRTIPDSPAKKVELIHEFTYGGHVYGIIDSSDIDFEAAREWYAARKEDAEAGETAAAAATDAATEAPAEAAGASLTDYQILEKVCEDLGCHMAVINSAEENQAIYDQLTSQHQKAAFFGLSDELVQDQWVWSGDESSYTNWSKGQPDHFVNKKGEVDHYGQFFASKGDGTWNDAPIGYKTTLFVLEWE